MERTILDFALVLLAFSVPLHIALSAHWRWHVSEWMRRVEADISDFVSWPEGEARPDMIAMLDEWREDRRRAAAIEDYIEKELRRAALTAAEGPGLHRVDPYACGL